VCDGRWADIEISTPQGMKFIYEQLYTTSKIEGKIVLANNRYKVRNITFQKTIKDDNENKYHGFGKPVNQISNGLWLVNKKNHNEIKLFPATKSRKDKFISFVYHRDTGKISGKIDLDSANWSEKILNSYNQKIYPSLRYCDYTRRNDMAKLTINTFQTSIPIECKTRGGRTFRNQKDEAIDAGNRVALNGKFDFELDKESVSLLRKAKVIDISFTNYHLMGNTFSKKIKFETDLDETIRIYKEYMERLKEEKLKTEKKQKSRANNAL
jgi:hypothetical protein